MTIKRPQPALRLPLQPLKLKKLRKNHNNNDLIVEYQNHDGEFYGDDRFCRNLKLLKNESVYNIVERSIGSLMEFGNNIRPQDDITLLGLELKN